LLQAGAGSQELLPKVPSAPQPQLGINMPALAVPNGAPDKAEEVIVCFGIIDILQVSGAAAADEVSGGLCLDVVGASESVYHHGLLPSSPCVAVHGPM
jgi:hypothetical protein